MPIKRLSIEPLRIPFRQTFVHASAVRAEMESVLVTVTNANGVEGIGEGCPRRYVTGETVNSVERFVEAHREEWMTLTSIQQLRDWVIEHASIIDHNPAAWCAVETAYLDLFGREAGVPVEALLGLPLLSGCFQYSAVLGTDSLQSFNRQLQQYQASRFSDFKVKVSGRLQNDIDKLTRLTATQDPKRRVRLDANNLWSDADSSMTYLRQLPGPITAIEEPLKVGDYDGCRRLARELKMPIILDESFLRLDQFASIQNDPPSTWIVNIRVSKMGGVLRSLTVAKQAKDLGIPIIIGAQVGETSVLTRAALTVANTYRDIVIAQEGAFGTLLLEKDICEPPLMFGAAGQLPATIISERAGLGLVSLRATS